MTTLRVFDPAMCCSTGVCGPVIDPALPRFAADLEWLAAQGVTVERFNLAQQPAAFAADASVRAALDAKGEASLPLIQVNGSITSIGVYPSREDLAAWAGIAGPAPSLYTDAVAELVAIGAAMAANCEPCFKFHYDAARKLGVSREDMRRAVATAQSVKETPGRAMATLADRFLKPGATEPAVAITAAGTGCCETSATADPADATGCGCDAPAVTPRRLPLITTSGNCC